MSGFDSEHRSKVAPPNVCNGSFTSVAAYSALVRSAPDSCRFDARREPAQGPLPDSCTEAREGSRCDKCSVQRIGIAATICVPPHRQRGLRRSNSDIMELSDRPCCRTAVCERRRRPRCLPDDRQRRGRSRFRTAWFCFQHLRQRCARYRGARRCSACRLKREIRETRHGEAARIATGVPGLPTWRRALAETALRRAVEKLGLI